MAITTYSEYEAAYTAVTTARSAAQEASNRQHETCVLAAEQRRDDAISNAANSNEIAAVFSQFQIDKEHCDNANEESQRIIVETFAAQLADIEQQARDGLAKLGRLIVTWKDLEHIAEVYHNSQWFQNGTGTAAEPAPILAVRGFDELRATLDHDRRINELLLVTKADNEALVLRGERKTLSAIATEWEPVQTRVSDAVYLQLELTGAAPDDADAFRDLMGAGTVELAVLGIQAVTTNKLCFPISMFATNAAASEFGKLAHRLINHQYCGGMGCTPVNDYFDDNNPAAWRDFLVSHDPFLATPAGSHLLLGISGVRPDICTNNGARKEYYEIKPASPSGVSDGIGKLFTIWGYMNRLRQPYRAGRMYSPTEIPIAHAVYAGITIEISLNVFRPLNTPGLIVYQLCVEAPFAELLVLVTMAALVAALLAEIIAAAAAIMHAVMAGVALVTLVLA